MAGRCGLRVRGSGAEYRVFAVLVVVIAASYALSQVISATMSSDLSNLAIDGIEVFVISSVSAVVLWFGLIRGMRAEARRRTFERQLHSALEMAETESGSYLVVARASKHLGLQGHLQMLLADSSEAHLKPAVSEADSAVPGCAVVAPFECPAIRRGQTLIFPSSAELDACPHLSGRVEAGQESLAALCIPLNVVGRSIGVLHFATLDSSRPGRTDVVALETVAEQTSARIGMVRVMEQTHLQAATDPLTGLLNRRSLENQTRDLLRGGDRFAVAMGDLDHFKKLNDTHGHDAGDRALRVFARTLQAALRSDDIICRYGGEEFVIVFPRMTATEASRALERVREALILAIAAGSIPPFTASFGVADSDDAIGFEELVRAADTALFQAKRQGRNRVVVDDSATVA
jgi:diguanylate cyclase (GGDEF)-like protein